MLFNPLFPDTVSALIFAVVLAIFAAILAGGKKRNTITWTFFSFMFVFPIVILATLPDREKTANAFIDKNKAIKKLEVNSSLSGLEKDFYEKCNELVKQTNSERMAFNELLQSTEDSKVIDKRCNLSQRSYRQIKKNSDLETRAICSHYNVMIMPRKISRVLGKYKELKLLIEHEINRLEGIEVEIENGNFHNTLLKTASENPIHCHGCGARVSMSHTKCEYCHVYLR